MSVGFNVDPPSQEGSNPGPTNDYMGNATSVIDESIINWGALYCPVYIRHSTRT